MRLLGTGRISTDLFSLRIEAQWDFIFRNIFCAQIHPRSGKSGEHVSRNHPSVPKFSPAAENPGSTFPEISLLCPNLSIDSNRLYQFQLFLHEHRELFPGDIDFCALIDNLVNMHKKRIIIQAHYASGCQFSDCPRCPGRDHGSPAPWIIFSGPPPISARSWIISLTPCPKRAA